MGKDNLEFWVKVLISLILALIWGALSTFIDPSLFWIVALATFLLTYLALAVCGESNGNDEYLH